MDCIEASGAVNSSGYVHRGGIGVHRLAWIEVNGPIPEGMLVMHACDNRRCINVEHLLLGTQGDNMRDMAAKRRQWQQSKTECKNGHPLTPENVYPSERGHRNCKVCARASAAERYSRMKVVV